MVKERKEVGKRGDPYGDRDREKRNRNIREQRLFPNVSRTRSLNTKGKPIAAPFLNI